MISTISGFKIFRRFGKILEIFFGPIVWGISEASFPKCPSFMILGKSVKSREIISAPTNWRNFFTNSAVRFAAVADNSSVSANTLIVHIFRLFVQI